MNRIQDLKAAVARNAAEFAAWLFPAGKRKGSKWHIGDASGTPGGSLVVDLEGAFAGDFRDWATGERGDCIDLVMAAFGLEFISAVQCLAQRYSPGGFQPLWVQDAGRRAQRTDALSAPASQPEGPKAPKLPRLSTGCDADLQRLSAGRNLAPESLQLAAARGVLWFYDSSEGRAWLITDRARCNAQARRLDGKPWAWHRRKAWTLRGSCASWPIGLPESEPFPTVALCEGGPDLLAAFHHALASGLEQFIAPVCIVGAGITMPARCLPAFAGKRVRIFVHDDEEGLKAGKKWAAQLNAVASHVDGYVFTGLTRSDGVPVKDLCDLASIDADSWEANRDSIEGCMDFGTKGRTP